MLFSVEFSFKCPVSKTLLESKRFFSAQCAIWYSIGPKKCVIRCDTVQLQTNISAAIVHMQMIKFHLMNTENNV